MKSPLLQFIETKLAELETEAGNLRARLTAISAQRIELMNAKSAAESVVFRSTKERMTDRPSPKRIKPNTIMENIMVILEKNIKGLIALDILRILNESREPPLLRESLSPQLSRLKQSGFIDLEDTKWKLVRRDWRSPQDLFSDVALSSSIPVGPMPKHEETADTNPTKDMSAASEVSPAKGREAGPGGGA